MSATLLQRQAADMSYTPKQWTCQWSFFSCQVHHHAPCQPIERTADESERLASISVLEHAVLVRAWDGFPHINQALVGELQRQMKLPSGSFSLPRVIAAADALLSRNIISRDNTCWYMTPLGEDYLD